MRLFLSLFSLAGLCLFFLSCRRDVYSPDACYNQTIKPLITSNCTRSGCHNSKDQRAGLDLSTFSGLMKIVQPGSPLRSELYKVIRAKGESRMPPDHSLSKDEIAVIKSWIAFGARENDCEGKTCDSVNVSYSKQVSEILSKNCLGCHNSGVIVLNNYVDVKNKVSSGALLGSIKQQGGFRSMPEGYKLSDCDIRIIELWINAGAPNN